MPRPLLLVLLGLLPAAGCGEAKTVPVEGTVVWADGTPAADLAGFVVESAVPGSRVSARGEIDGEGRFRLGTYEDGDGVEPGTHLVLIAPRPRADFEPAPKVKLPARYARFETSGLTFTAERGKTNEVTLTVARK